MAGILRFIRCFAIKHVRMLLGVCLYNYHVFTANFIDTASIICYNNNIQFYVVRGDRMKLVDIANVAKIAGSATNTVKPITTKAIDFAKAIYSIGSLRSIGKGYPNHVEIAYETTLNIAFGVNTNDTIEHLLESTDKPELFAGYLLESCGGIIDSYFEDERQEHYGTYKHLISELAKEACKKDFKQKWAALLDDNRRFLLTIDGQNCIRESIESLSNNNNECFKTLISMVTELLNMCTSETKSEPEPTPTIKNDNEYYEKKYSEILFMEHDPIFVKEIKKHQEKKVNLQQTFVEPEMEFDDDNCGLIEKLQEWSRSFDDADPSGISAEIFLLYGQPGGGKSSLTSRILSENYFGENCHAARLNEHLDAMNHIDPWQSVKDCFKCQDDSCYEGTVLILDGFDEVCVLKKEFQGHDFINNLKNAVPDSVKILITSREYKGYFDEVYADNALLIGTVKWTDGKLREWCNNYSSVHKCRTDWCNEFPAKFDALSEPLKDALGTPIILYICCVRDIDISKHDSIAGIYEEAFKDICLREYNKRGDTTHANEHRLYWQYTKEIAFQMFLNNTLSTAQADDPVEAEKTLVQKAQEKTYEICKETIPDLPKSQELNLQLKRCFGVFPFIAPKATGIEFAHKTVGEYFTAVKLYEDYFGKLFPNGEKTEDEKVWTTIFQAFRYNRIPEDIINYLIEITDKRLENAKWTDSDLSAEDRKKIWRERLFRSFHEGMTGQYWWKCLGKEELDYTSGYGLLNTQVELTFANFSQYLTKLGFAEYDKVNYKYSNEFAKVLGTYLPRFALYDINCKEWKCLKGVYAKGAVLNDTNLSDADLRGANLSHASLIGAKLIDAKLNDANLIGEDLRDTVLKYAHLNKANLSGANLKKADLRYADLNYANLNGANLKKADL